MHCPKHQLMVKAQTVILVLGSYLSPKLDPLSHVPRGHLASCIPYRSRLWPRLPPQLQVTDMVKTSSVSCLWSILSQGRNIPNPKIKVFSSSVLSLPWPLPAKRQGTLSSVPRGNTGSFWIILGSRRMSYLLWHHAEHFLSYTELPLSLPKLLAQISLIFQVSVPVLFLWGHLSYVVV